MSGRTLAKLLKKKGKTSGSKPKPAQQRVMILQANGKIGFDWRPNV